MLLVSVAAKLPKVMQQPSTIINAAALQVQTIIITDSVSTNTDMRLILFAVLQDHLARSITLNLFPKKLPVRSNNQNSAAVRAKSQFHASGKQQLIGKQREAPEINKSPLYAATEYRKVWVCEACTFENEELQPHQQQHDRERCSACDTFRVKLDARASLTLAQKRGLVACPPPKLSRDDWDRCEKQAEARGDLAHPCSICRELFGVKEQVILSCSHVFHLDCLTSFER